MNKLQNFIIPVFAIIWCVIVILDQITGNYFGISFIIEEWASMTIITSLLFIFLFSIQLISSSEKRRTLFIILGIISAIDLISALLFEDRNYISSIATSSLFITLSLHGFYFERNEKFYLRFFLIFTVYTISNIILIIYFLDPLSIYELPGFESVSWNTAIGFLIYASTMLSNYHGSLLQKINLPKDISIINKKFIDFWFNLSFLFPILIILSISILHFLGVVSSKVGMGISLFFVCLLPFPITYFIYRETVSWSIKMYRKNRKIFFRDQDIRFHNQLLQEFAQITSHNLRGPIVSLSNLTKIALDDETSEDITKRSFELLEEKLPSLVTTVDSLADFYNMIKTGEIAYQTCDFREILDEVIIDCKNTYDTNELSLNIEFDLNEPTIEYPSIYIRNLLYNLVSNSIKYRKKEGPLILVFKTNSMEPEGIELCYRDNGLGMDLTYFKKHIFKFGKSYHNFSNSKGIGLFIVKNQLARLGDTIDVYSEEGEYTEFKIKLNYHGKKELGYS